MKTIFKLMNEAIESIKISSEKLTRKYRACKGDKCGATDGRSHSPECLLEYARTIDRRSPAWESIANNPPPKSVRILIYSKQEGLHRAYLNDHGHYMSDEMLSTRYKPTHWMQRPEPPK